MRTIYEVNGTARYIEMCWPATYNDAILAPLLQHKEDEFSKPTVENRFENRSQHIRSKKMVDQLSSGMIGGDCHLYPTRRQCGYLHRCSDRLGAAATRRGQVAESGRRRNIWSWGTASFQLWCNSKRRTKIWNRRRKNIRQWHQTPAGKALLLVQRVLSSHHFLHYSTPHNLGVASKVTTLATVSIFFFADRLVHLRAVFRVAENKFHCGRRVA